MAGEELCTGGHRNAPRRRCPGGRSALALLGLLAAAPAAAQEAGPPGAAAGATPLHLPTADQCMACHNGLATASGEDVSLGTSWRATMMANSARDPYWQAAVRRETLDHPSAAAEIEAECSRCHMPLAHVAARSVAGESEVFAHLPVGPRAEPEDLLAADGVSCAACHQIEPDGLGEEASFTGGFVVDLGGAPGERRMYGPFEVDEGRSAIMSSAVGARPTEATHLQRSELCATCHTLYTNTLGPDGEVVGRLPEQVPFLEWRHSAWPAEASCQSCHMPVVDEPVAITSVWGREREGMSRHEFRGGNFLVLRMLSRYRNELGVAALPHELDRSAERTLAHLGSASAEVALTGGAVREDGTLGFTVAVRNLAGHKLPTAYPSRRAWLHVTVRDGAGRVLFESGAPGGDGAIRGNDHDADPGRFEPHHEEITDPGQVQIYESVLADPDGAPTTGLLTGVRFIKDNRLLPRGFDKATAAADIAVHGPAADDPDFGDGGDLVRYVVPASGASGPLRVEVALLYQPIGFRWAENLAEYDAFEPRRFVSYWRSMSSASVATLATAALDVP